jgi:hypothetical protein
MAERIKTFREFWPFYVSEHSKSLTRTLHFIGSTLVLASVATAAVTGNGWFLVGAPVAGYGFAWVGHFFVEKNRPATFKYPFYSFAADWVMYAKIVSGQMGEEVRAHARPTAT